MTMQPVAQVVVGSKFLTHDHVRGLHRLLPVYNQVRPGRHCHFTLSLTAIDAGIDGRSLGIYIQILLSFSVQMTVSPLAKPGQQLGAALRVEASHGR
jgi:hypothetical protein